MYGQRQRQRENVSVRFSVSFSVAFSSCFHCCSAFLPAVFYRIMLYYAAKHSQTSEATPAPCIDQTPTGKADHPPAFQSGLPIGRASAPNCLLLPSHLPYHPISFPLHLLNPSALCFSCAFQALPFRSIIEAEVQRSAGPFSFTFFVSSVHYTIPLSIFAFCFAQGFISPKSERAKSRIVL